MRRSLPLSPSTVIACAALFFALGGSAFALGDHALRASKAQPRCAQGAIRGIAIVTGDPARGIDNIPTTFTGDPKVFYRKFNCTGKGVQVRRVSTGVYEVQFLGNSVDGAVGNVLAAERGPLTVAPIAAGVFRVAVRDGGTQQNSLTYVDSGFVIVAI